MVQSFKVKIALSILIFVMQLQLYVTSDTHRGKNVNISFGYYFDGFLNFIAINEHLVNNYGLGNSDYVLKMGGGLVLSERSSL